MEAFAEPMCAAWPVPGQCEQRLRNHALPQSHSGLMDKALVLGTTDCRFESCQGHFCDTEGAACMRASN